MIRSLKFSHLSLSLALILGSQDGFCPPKVDDNNKDVTQYHSIVVGGVRKHSTGWKPHWVLTEDQNAFVINRDKDSEPDLAYDICTGDVGALDQELKALDIKNVNLLHFEHVSASISKGATTSRLINDCNRDVFERLVDTVKPGGTILFQSFYTSMLDSNSSWADSRGQMYPVRAKLKYNFPPLIMTEKGRPLHEKAERLNNEIKAEISACIKPTDYGYTDYTELYEYYGTRKYKDKQAELLALFKHPDYPKLPPYEIVDPNPVIPQLQEAVGGRWEMSLNEFQQLYHSQSSHMNTAIDVLNDHFRSKLTISKITFVNPTGATVPPFYEIECIKK